MVNAGGWLAPTEAFGRFAKESFSKNRFQDPFNALRYFRLPELRDCCCEELINIYLERGDSMNAASILPRLSTASRRAFPAGQIVAATGAPYDIATFVSAITAAETATMPPLQAWFYRRLYRSTSDENYLAQAKGLGMRQGNGHDAACLQLMELALLTGDAVDCRNAISHLKLASLGVQMLIVEMLFTGFVVMNDATRLRTALMGLSGAYARLHALRITYDFRKTHP